MRTKRNTMLVSLMICFLVFVCAALFTKRAEGNAYAEDTPVEVEAKDFVVQIVNQDTPNNRTLLYLTYYGGEANIYNGLTRGDAWENHPDGTDPLFVIEKTDGTTENQWYGGWTETLGDINKTASVFALPLDISSWKSATMKAGLYSGGKVKLKDDLVIRSVDDTWVAASFKNTDFTVFLSGKDSDDYIYLERKGTYNLISGNWGVFADQKQTFTAKKSDGTTKSIDSNYLQIDRSIIYIKFNKDTLDDCVELTFPEGAYKLTDGNYGTYRYIESGFTFYKHSDGNWYNEKETFALSFMGEPTNMIKEGWANGDATIADDVLTLPITGNDSIAYSPNVSLKGGTTYIIKTDIRTSGNGMGIRLWETGAWTCVFKGGASANANAVVNPDGYIWTTANWGTISVSFTPSKDVAQVYFANADGDVASLQLKNFTITEIFADSISVVEGGTLTNLPAVPEREGYVGHWEIDGVAISSATIYDYNSNKNAVAVYKEGYKLIIKDGNSTTYKAVGNKVRLSDLGIRNSDTKIVAGYKINGKLYSEDYVLTVSGEVEIEVIRVSFKMKHGGSIKYVAPIGLRFSANLSESEYNSLKDIVGEGNISFGIELQRVSDSVIVSTSGERFYIENESIVYSGVILEIPENYYTEKFTANAYLLINYEDKSESIRVYSIGDDNTRSVYTVAKNAIEAGITGEALSVCEEIVNKVESTGIVEEIADDQVVIGAFEVPANIETTIKYAKDAGIDVLFAAFAGNTTEYFADASASESLLQAIQSAGLKVYISALEGNDGYRTFPSLGDNERAAAFMGYDAVAGYVIDEPTKYEIESIADKLEEVKKNFNNKTLYVNLFPSFWSGIETDFGGDYKAYLSFFCEKVLSKLETGEKWLSVDRYPLVYDADGNKCLDDGWLSDIQDVVEVAKEYNAKTNIFIQTTPFGKKTAGGHDRVPALEDIRLQAMSLMAFGVDGVGLFSYATTVENDEYSETQMGMIDRNGNRTAIYYSVKTAISELKNFEKVIKGYDYQGIFTTDAGGTMKNSDTLASTTNSSFRNIGRTALSVVGGVNKVSSTQDTLYGYSKDAKGNLALTVVNYNDTSKNLTDTVTIAFDTSKYNAVIYYERGIRKFASLNASGEIVLNIGVGEGVFVVPCMAK